MNRVRGLAALSWFCFAAAGCGPGRFASASQGVLPSPVVRVYSTKTGAFVSFGRLVREASRADIVFFGEQHDDPVTHATELALLAAVGERRARLVLSLEMFERDVQDTLNRYLRGQSSEAELLAASRPWERYATDYRGMIELARVRGWPVVAANVPRRLASAVSRAGLAAVDTMAAADKRWLAKSHTCPRDDEYFRRFSDQMKEHGSGGPSSPSDTAALRDMTSRFYDAQCVKDEAMGEAVADAWRSAGRGAIVVHYNGAFHSDFGLGTASRTRARLSAARIVVISAIPVASLDEVAVTEHLRRADFLVFTKQLDPHPE